MCNSTTSISENARTIHQLFEEQVKRTPDHIALILGNSKLTYSELDYRANQLAGELRKRGLRADDLVGILMRRSVEMLVGILGVLKAGSAFLPIDPDYPKERIRFMLEDSNTKIMLSQYVLNNGVHYAGDVINLDELVMHDGVCSSVDNINIPTDLAYVIYTSGSTGTPKGVMIEHRAVVNFIKGIVEKITFTVGQKILALTSISFDIFVLETLLPLTRGLTVVLADENVQKNPRLLEKMIIENHIDMLQLTPSRLQLLLNYDENLRCFRDIKEIMIGGEALHWALLERVKRHTNARIYNMYGPTETTIWSTVSDVTEKHRIDIGKPIINTQIYIIDENNGLAPVDTEGELCIGGCGLTRGYLNRPDLTKDKFVANPFIFGERMYKTGDLAKWLPDGDIEWIGRKDDQVKVRGYRVELGEIEAALMKHPFIRQAVVTAWVGKENFTYLCSYFVSDEEICATDLREYLVGILPDYMVPVYFIRMNRMPLTPNGKVDRKALSDLDPSLCFENEKHCLSDENESAVATVENRLIKVVTEHTEIAFDSATIDCYSNLADLGISSLNFIKIVIAIEAEFDFEFDADDLNPDQFPTVQSLVSYVEKSMSCPSSSRH